MPITFVCPTCSHTFSVTDDLAGRTATCNKCGAKFTIPNQEVTPVPTVLRPTKSGLSTPRPRPKKSGQALTWVLPVLFLVLAGGSCVAYWMIRDTWEQDNKIKVLEMKQTADVYCKNKIYDQAKIAYKTVVLYVGDRQLKDAQLSKAFIDSKTKLLDIELLEKNIHAKQVKSTEEKLLEKEKEAARLAKEKENAITKAQAEEIARLKEKSQQQDEIIQKQDDEDSAKAAKEEDEERKEADKRLAEAKKNERDAAEAPAPLPPVVIAPIPPDANKIAPIPPDANKEEKKGAECPLCLGLKKGSYAFNDPQRWFDGTSSRMTTKWRFEPVANGDETCPSCNGKGRTPDAQPLLSFIRKPNFDDCKNCEGFGRVVRSKQTNKLCGFPYGGKCSKCLGTGLTPGSVSAGRK